MDDGIGKVIKALKDSNQYTNTLIIFTSDNGGHIPSLANNGPFRDGKQSVYEGGLKVPTVISWPSRIEKNKISNKVLMSVDFFPTILEIAGQKNSYDTDGLSFTSELFKPNENNLNNREMFFTRREGGLNYGGKTINAFRKGSWKLLQNSPYKSYELYNLESDPMEKNNLVDKEPEIFTKLNKLLMRQIQTGGRIPWQK